MKNQLTLHIDDKPYSLRFNIGTYNHVADITGEDPFKFKAASDSYKDVMAYAKVIFLSALRTDGYLATQEEAEVLFNQLSAADVTLIINMYNNPVDSKPSLNGEVSKDTQSAAQLG